MVLIVLDIFEPPFLLSKQKMIEWRQRCEHLSAEFIYSDPPVKNPIGLAHQPAGKNRIAQFLWYQALRKLACACGIGMVGTQTSGRKECDLLPLKNRG
jgi:hypothetical protein